MKPNKRHIYADNAATTPLSRKAYEAMLPYLLDDYGNASQPYVFARSPKKALKEARAAIADCIGAFPEEIYFTSGGTESNNWVIQGAFRQSKHIIISEIEHHSILKPCAAFGDATLLPVSSEGIVLRDVLVDALENHSPGLVSIMFANNEIGSIEPIGELVDVAHKNGWLFHSDAVQAIGHTPLKVYELEIDMLSASAHKFNGPKGIGFLFKRKGLEWPSFLLGGSQESGYRAGTENVASIVGMATALQENIDTLHENVTHLQRLEQLLINGLKANNVSFCRNGSQNHIVGNISLSFPDEDGEAILHRLDLMGISVSTGSACDSKNTQISHVLRAIGLKDSFAKGTIRISLSRRNTEDDISKIVKGINTILNKGTSL